MESRPKQPRNEMDPGKRLLQLALRQAMSSKLSLMSQFKREFDKKKQEKWKSKKENCQDHAIKSCFVPLEMAGNTKVLEKHEVTIDLIEKKNEFNCNRVPKGRGRGKLLLNQPRQSLTLGKNLETVISNPDSQNCANDNPSGKLTETTKKIDEHKNNFSTIENKMTIQSNRVPKGRGRGRSKPSSNQPGLTNSFGKSIEVSHYSSELCNFSNVSSTEDSCKTVRNESVSESPIQLHHQFFSYSESNIPKYFVSSLQSDSVVTVCNEKIPLHSSDSRLLDSSSVHSSDLKSCKTIYPQKRHQTLHSSDSCLLDSSSVHSSDLKSCKTIYPHGEENSLQTKDNLSFHDTWSPSVSDLGYYSSSNLSISNNKFSNIMQTKDFDLEEKGDLLRNKNNQRYFSFASLNESGNKYSSIKQTEDFDLQKRKSKSIHDKWLTYATDQASASHHSAPKPVAFIKAYTHKEITSPTVSNMNKEIVNHILHDSSHSCIDANSFSNYSVPLTENHKNLALTDLSQFQSAMLLKNTSFHEDEISDQNTSKIKSAAADFHKYCEIEPEDKYIDELIDSFTNKTKGSCNGSLIDNTKHNSDPRNNYIDEFTGTFSDKSINICNLKDKFINESNVPFVDESKKNVSPEDKYHDQVTESFIDKIEESCNSKNKYIDEMIESFINNTKCNPDNNCTGFSDKFIAMCNIGDQCAGKSIDPFLDKLIQSFIDNAIDKCNSEKNCIDKSIGLFSDESIDMCNVEEKCIDKSFDSFLDKSKYEFNPEDKCKDESIALFIDNIKNKFNPEDNCINDPACSFSDKFKDMSDPEEEYINELIESYFGKTDDKRINDLNDFIEDMEDKHVYDLINSFVGKNSNALN